ncbi:hypothetical protein PVAP13_5NG397700 [Panicum virgatum]|uniref:Uncharacterized protein n=1 Tax=Panicum virgatum TaxID=38727 RepID=A0A8T0RRJ3_PANVG|nr:hypothetical protein PVAP13_9NG610814 [Panicum virgatum]KAG2589022.1 hypothetical protein PVAP13_5NG397700 [Panicum virgatum]
MPMKVMLKTLWSMLPKRWTTTARNVLRTTFLEKSKVQCSSAHWGTFLFVLVKNCSLE